MAIRLTISAINLRNLSVFPQKPIFWKNARNMPRLYSVLRNCLSTRLAKCANLGIICIFPPIFPQNTVCLLQNTETLWNRISRFWPNQSFPFVRKSLFIFNTTSFSVMRRSLSNNRTFYSFNSLNNFLLKNIASTTYDKNKYN